MASNDVGHVLAILRLMKKVDNPSATIRAHVDTWAGEPSDNAKVARIVAFLLDRVQGAEAQIVSSGLTGEAQQGLLQTTSALKSAFDLTGLQSPIHQYLPALDAAISQYVLLVGVFGLADLSKAPADLAGLIKEVEAITAALDDVELDPLVSDTARRHLGVLRSLLQNVDALGADAALAAYYELVIRLRRAEAGAPASTAQKMAKLWPTIEKWAGRIALLNDAYDAGASLVSHIEKVAPLLTHLNG